MAYASISSWREFIKKSQYLSNSKNVSLKAVSITTVMVVVVVVVANVYSFVVKCHVELNVAPYNVM